RAGEAGVGRAEEREELPPAAVRPDVAQELQERMPERCRAEARTRLEGVRDAEAAEHRLERRPPFGERRRHERDPLRRDAAADEGDELVRDELERAAAPGSLEEADGSVELRGRRRGLLEERPLEVRERRVRVLAGTRRKLLDAPVRERRQILRGARERREGHATGLVGQR